MTVGELRGLLAKAPQDAILLEGHECDVGDLQIDGIKVGLVRVRRHTEYAGFVHYEPLKTAWKPPRNPPPARFDSRWYVAAEAVPAVVIGGEVWEEDWPDMLKDVK